MTTAYKKIFDAEFQRQAREKRSLINEETEANMAEHQLLATTMLPRNGEDAPTMEQFTSELTESDRTQKKRTSIALLHAKMNAEGNSSDDDVVDLQEQRSLIAARDGNGVGGGNDHIASNFLLWTKETLRKAIINAGYTGSGLRNKVLPTKDVLLHLYRTHVLELPQQQQVPGALAISDDIPSIFADNCAVDEGDVSIKVPAANQQETEKIAEESDDAGATKRARHEEDSTMK